MLRILKETTKGGVMLQQELEGKRVVVALGGNALGDNPTDQLKLLDNTAKNLAHMVKEGSKIIVTHGNGPQVGVVDEAFVVASQNKKSQVPLMPLSDCNAMSQGYIGAQLTCVLMNEFHAQNIMRTVANVPTHVLVDADDPAFKNFQKPIGAFMTEEDAKAFSKQTGFQVGPDSGRGWRRMVPSPVPQDILELEVVRDLMEDGCVTVAAGGGGVPVVMKNGAYHAVDAVIDKDLVSALLAWRIRADMLIILTAVEKVYINFNQPNQQALDVISTEEARQYCAQGQFAPGSMLPKVEACIKFVEAHPGGRALITSLEYAAEGLRGETGTLITTQGK
jgi:carbamate kinase